MADCAIKLQLFNKLIRLFFMVIALIILPEKWIPKRKVDASNQATVALLNTRRIFKSFQITLQGVNLAIKCGSKINERDAAVGLVIHTATLGYIKTHQGFSTSYLFGFVADGGNTICHGTLASPI